MMDSGDLVDAAIAVVMEVLTTIVVHPCDEGNLDVAARQLYGPMEELYRVLKELGQI